MDATKVFFAYEQAAKELNFVRITNRTRDRIAVQIDYEDGRGTVRVYVLFPGILLGFNEISGGSFPSYQGKVAHGIKINFCIDGRCEIKMSDGRYLFLEMGDLSIDTRTAGGKFTFPYDRFYGIELFIHDSALEQPMPVIFREVGIDIDHIRRRYCPDEQSFIAKAGDKVRSVFLKIAESLPEYELSYFRLQITELLFLLMYMEKPVENERRSVFTTGQVNIAKQVMKIITQDLSAHHRVDTLAKNFCISPTSLKNYFHGVYGQSISAYLRDKRMDKAAEYLEKSARPVADIALLMGYENASKFSSAFKLAKGESPLEYRRKYRGSR
ncbi:MAG: AraC family transcriptional regulator [Treponema sp.]|jgi:AraC-like DNA-binding protein|nr:AraC family transcriptional regulator [Treponema sp.]